MTRRKTIQPTPPRVEILRAAERHTAGERDVEYGPPIINLTDCANMFSAYLICRFRDETVNKQTFILTAQDIAWLNELQKMCRTMSGNVKLDTYEDAAAYAAIAGECAIEEAAE